MKSNKKQYILLIIGILIQGYIFAQNITGTIQNKDGEPLIGANVYWQNATFNTVTDIDGFYEIPYFGKSTNQLIASYVGYLPDTIGIDAEGATNFTLKENTTLSEVLVSSRKNGVVISDLQTIKTEQITSTELGKSACCDLAGCFGTQTSVKSQTTNIITNSKELRILGLSGIYNQVLIDGFPMIQATSFTYGISSVPGTLVENIYVSKGANSVLQGYESISGQINVETKEPDNTDQLFLNLYMNSFGVTQLNGQIALKKNKWSNLLALHTEQPGKIRDKDKDNFRDLPAVTRYTLFNKLQYGNDKQNGFSSAIGLRLLSEERNGGQVDFDSEKHQGSDQVYGQSVSLKQPDIWIRSNYRINEKHNVVAFLSGFNQVQTSYFGTTKYDATQFNHFTKIQYEYFYDVNDFKIGASNRFMDLKENIQFLKNPLNRTYAGDFHKKEQIPGVFAENTLQFYDNKFTWILGARADFHNDFGTQFTPRTLLKFNAAKNTVIRGNIGSGWRTANIFSENIGLLVSSRDVVFEETLKPEKAWNYGVNLTHKYEKRLVSGFLSADYYRTDFENQIFPDYDTDPTKAYIRNFTGESISNGLQLEAFMSIDQVYEFKFGYNYLDVYRKVEGIKENLPFTAKHKLLGTFSYNPKGYDFHFDMNAHWYSKKRLPNTSSNPVEFQRADFSNPYGILNAQFTYEYKAFEFYTGCENIFNFTQKQAIISWEDPFGKYFDTSSVWGPTRGREFYLGIRYRIGELK